MTGMQTRYYEGNGGIRLAADVGGELGQPPVILLHGGGQTRRAWGRASRELTASGFQVICLDSRGHGDSEWAADGDYSLDALANDLREVMATLQQPPILIGASLGGATALLVAGEGDSEQVRALILVDVVPRSEPAGLDNILRFMSARPEGFDSIEEVADAVASYNPHRPRPSDYAGLMKNVRRNVEGRLVWHWDPMLIKPLNLTSREERNRRLENAAAKVRVPTLLVRGAMSDLVSEDGARALQKTIPGCEWIDVAGAGHMIAGDRNDHFNAAVIDFLLRHVPPQ